MNTKQHDARPAAQGDVEEIKLKVVEIFHRFAPTNAVPGVKAELDSLGFMAFVVDLEREFRVSFNNEDLTKENFKNADSIAVFLQKITRRAA